MCTKRMMSAKILFIVSYLTVLTNGQRESRPRTSNIANNFNISPPVESSYITSDSTECPQQTILPAQLIVINRRCSSVTSGTTKIVPKSVAYLSSTLGPGISNTIHLATTSVVNLSSAIQQTTSVVILNTIVSPVSHPSIGVTLDTIETSQQTSTILHLSSTPVTSATIEQTTSVVTYLSSTPEISTTIEPTATAVTHLSSTPEISISTQQTTSVVTHLSPIPEISTTIEQTTSAVTHLSSTPEISTSTQQTTNAVFYSSTPVILETTKISYESVSVLVESHPSPPVSPGTQNVGLVTGIAITATLVVIIFVLTITVVGVTILIKVRRNHHSDKVVTTGNEAYGAIPLIHIEDDAYDYPTINYKVMDSINTTQNEAYATNTEVVQSMSHCH